MQFPLLCLTAALCLGPSLAPSPSPAPPRAQEAPAAPVRLLPTTGHLIVPQCQAWSLDRSAAAVALSGLKVEVRVTGAVARTTLDLEVSNGSGAAAEATLLVPVARGAAVVGFELEGTSVGAGARLLPEGEARATYDAVVAELRDPALLEFVGQPLVRSQVFPVPAGGSQRLRLVTEQLLVADGGRFDYVLPRSESLARAVPFELEVELEASGPLRTWYSPSHALDVLSRDERHLHLRLPEAGRQVPGPFRLSWVVADRGVGVTAFHYPDAQDGGGWFLLLAGLPEATAAERAAADARVAQLKREVTLVLDRSGSMEGEKLEQARAAALAVLGALHDGERVQLIDYAADVQRFSDLPRPTDGAARAEARQYLQGLHAEGGTDLHGALSAALQGAGEVDYLPLVLFLTDGLPTAGVTSELEIRALAERFNPLARRIFPVGVGHDVNAPLLDRLAAVSGGRASYVLPGEDVEASLVRVFESLEGPVLTDLQVEAVGADGALDPRALRSLSPGKLPDLYRGEPLVLLGRYAEGFRGHLRLSAQGAEGPLQFELPLEPVAGAREHSFVPRLWAARRIDQLTEEVRQAGAAGEVGAALMTELSDQIVRLSTRFGILTEYTSYLATEGAVLGEWNDLLMTCSSNLEDRAVAVRSGAGAVNQALNHSQRAQQAQLDYSNRYWTAGLEQVELGGVQQLLGCHALFRRGNAWIDGRLLGRGELQADRTVEIGSPDYWDLAEDLEAVGERALLANLGELWLAVDGQVVRIVGDDC
jgi:Ca-activated chloride channel family protein